MIFFSSPHRQLNRKKESKKHTRNRLRRTTADHERKKWEKRSKLRARGRKKVNKATRQKSSLFFSPFFLCWFTVFFFVVERKATESKTNGINNKQRHKKI